MARLICRESVGTQRVYDVTTTPTHSFLAKSDRSKKGSPFLLAHNSHRLSTSALDALLKPMEENIRGSMDKKIVCIFCTTEPEKMRATILSRCAPVFTIQVVEPEEIAERLAMICGKEGITFDQEALVQIAEMTECHIRDALKAIEGISKLGGVSRENVVGYFRLDLMDIYLEMLLGLREELAKTLENAEVVLKQVSPVVCYERLSDLSLFAYKIWLGIEKKIPVYWDRNKIVKLGEIFGDELLRFTQTFSSRPARPTGSMLLCDLAELNKTRQIDMQLPVSFSDKSGTVKKDAVGSTTIGGVNVVAAAVKQPQSDEPKKSTAVQELSIKDFCQLLDERLTQQSGDFSGEANGSSGRQDLGGD